MADWPGMGMGPQVPFNPAPFQRQPMFGGQLGPRYTGPYNFGGGGGGGGMLLQMLLPQLLQGVMGQHMPMQFFPQQSVVDQMIANQMMARQAQAMQQASRRDQSAMADLMRGAEEVFRQRPLTAGERVRNQRIVETVGQYMPMASMILGPDLIDAMHGAGGSSQILAQQLAAATRMQFDPVTGRLGYSGASMGVTAAEVFARRFETPAGRAGMRGMTAGRAGVLALELQQRGLLGPGLGGLPMDERLAALPDLTEDRVARLAERVSMTADGRSIQDLRAANEEVTAEMIDAAKEAVRESLRRLRGGAAMIGDAELEAAAPGDAAGLRRRLARGLTGQERADLVAQVGVDQASDLEARAAVQVTARNLRDLPGGEDLLRAADADRMADRLENLSGAVAAMREIFGDLNNPNAPMRELINGLEALTQGGLATSSPAQLEAIVRRAQALANQSGVDVQSQLAMIAQAGGLADQLGLDRAFAVRGVQQGLPFAMAHSDTGPSIPSWGAITKEQLVLADQQLRMHAAAAPLTNQLAAMLRMEDRGMLQVAEGSQLEALLGAARRGETTYNFTDAAGVAQRGTLRINRATAEQLLRRDAGIEAATFLGILADQPGNQETTARYGLDATVRRMQRDDVVQGLLRSGIGNQLLGVVETQGGRGALEAAGLIDQDRAVGDQQLRRLMDEVGLSVGNEFFNLSADEVADTATRNQRLGALSRAGLRSAIARRMPGAAPADIDAVVNNVMAAVGPRSEAIMGEVAGATINRAAGRQPFGTLQGMHALLNPATERQARRREAMVEAERLTRESLGGLATEGPLSRLVTAFREAGPNTTPLEIFRQFMGGVDIQELAARDATGQVRAMLGLLEETQLLDPTTPEGMEAIQANARMIRGIVEGGDAAEAALAEIEADRPQIALGDATPEQRAAAIERLRRAEEADATGVAAMRSRDAMNTARLRAIEEGRVTRRGMLPHLLGDLGDIALGGGRTATSRGIVDAAGNVVGYDDEAAAAEALEVVKRVQEAQIRRTTAAEAAAAGRTEADLLAEAERRGLVRGEGDTPAATVQALREALAGRTAGAAAGAAAEPAAAPGGADQVRAVIERVGDMGQQVMEALALTREAVKAGPAIEFPEKLAVEITGTLRDERGNAVAIVADGISRLAAAVAQAGRA